ncbi:MAG: hypothetical protein IID45_03830 [Planctomycetes bacterium]|nr:hypothetical protein [Planctomycetota bacterium]
MAKIRYLKNGRAGGRRFYRIDWSLPALAAITQGRLSDALNAKADTQGLSAPIGAWSVKQGTVGSDSNLKSSKTSSAAPRNVGGDA